MRSVLLDLLIVLGLLCLVVIGNQFFNGMIVRNATTIRIPCDAAQVTSQSESGTVIRCADGRLIRVTGK